MADDRITGNQGVFTIDTPGTPIILDIYEFSYEEEEKFAEGRTAGLFGTGRRLVGLDWTLEANCRVRETGTTPNLFRRGADIAFDVRSDGAGTPALKIVGTGACSRPRYRGRVDEQAEYSIRVICSNPDQAGWPVITPG